MHTEITAGTRDANRKSLTEKFVLDDDEFNAGNFFCKLEHAVNKGTREERNFALERIQALGLKTSLKVCDGDDFLAVRM